MGEQGDKATKPFMSPCSYLMTNALPVMIVGRFSLPHRQLYPLHNVIVYKNIAAHPPTTEVSGNNLPTLLRHHPFTAPPTRLLVICSWSNTKMTILGSIVMIKAANKAP